MRGWAELTPYNFIHAMRLEEPADPERWREATAEALRRLDLEIGSLALETPKNKIDAHLEAELSRGFAVGELPLRFFLIDVDGGGHWFGVVLDHWFADDFSARALLRRIYSSYQSPEAPADRPELFLARKQPPRSNWIAEWSSFFRQAKSLRRACRLPLKDCLDFTAGVFRTGLPLGTLEAVRALAKQARATVHDVLLAAAAQACDAAHLLPPGARRDSIGLASAMDLRRFETGTARESFGLLISEYSVVEPHPEAVSLLDLTARIAATTRSLKQTSGRAVFVAGLLLWRLARSSHAQASLYQRGAPFAAGLSNVNLSGSWIEESEITEFRRVGPTGPVVPLLLMITTLRGRIFVDTTFRTSAFARADAERLVGDFAGRLASI